jgi:hypothetical protein
MPSEVLHPSKSLQVCAPPLIPLTHSCTTNSQINTISFSSLQERVKVRSLSSRIGERIQRMQVSLNFAFAFFWAPAAAPFTSNYGKFLLYVQTTVIAWNNYWLNRGNRSSYNQERPDKRCTQMRTTAIGNRRSCCKNVKVNKQQGERKTYMY